jgi:tetratricopeptide (TPR) repeat protein
LLGRIDDAVALFERINAIDPAQGAAALINARRFPEDAAALDKLEQLARRPNQEGSAHSGLLLQLARAWEKQKDFDKAFALATEANETIKRHLRYDPNESRQYSARIRRTFSSGLFEHRRDCGYRGEDASLPVFVLGMPRSGTTLVEQILAGHSQIFGAGELGVIPSCIQGLNRWERHLGSGRSYPDCIDDLSPRTIDAIARELLAQLKALAADKARARHVVDKLPHNFHHVGLIKLIFPRARIISVRRDPRDIALSNYFTDYQAKHGGMGFAYDLNWIGEHLADHNLLMHHWDRLFPGEILEVRYEDVIEHTEQTAKSMLSYIGVPWEPGVLAFHKLDRPVNTASVWQVRQPIYRTSQDKWRRYAEHLAPLIEGTNRRIEPGPVESVVLPEPGLLTDGVEFCRQGNLDEAEKHFKRLLHFLPDHAAANFMLGHVQARKGQVHAGIRLMEKALALAPWHRNWRVDLIRAYRLAGKTEKAESLERMSSIRRH